MKRRALSALSACLLLLSACSQIKETTAPPEPLLPDNPLQTAEKLAADGRLGEAVSLLEQAIAQGRGNEAYIAALSATARQQKTLEDQLQAKLLLEETKALQKQLPILDKLAYSNPRNQHVAEKLKTVRRGLETNRNDLSKCGWKQSEHHGNLAKQCLEVALSIEANAEDQRLLDQLTTKKEQTREKEVKKQRGIREKQWKNRNQDRLQQARQLFRNSQYAESRTQLIILLREDPSNEAAKKLLNKLQTELKSYLDTLLAAGDRMYREGEIEGAKALWQAALKLDPNDSRVKDKIERADRVLKNLESLRKTN